MTCADVVRREVVPRPNASDGATARLSCSVSSLPGPPPPCHNGFRRKADLPHQLSDWFSFAQFMSAVARPRPALPKDTIAELDDPRRGPLACKLPEALRPGT